MGAFRTKGDLGPREVWGVPFVGPAVDGSLLELQLYEGPCGFWPLVGGILRILRSGWGGAGKGLKGLAIRKSQAMTA